MTQYHSAAESDAPPPAIANPEQPFYGNPFRWLLFAIALIAVPLLGYMLQSGMEDLHPAVNAVLNGTSTVFLIAGYVAVRRRNIAMHRSCMVAAFIMSAVFLASYITRFIISGTHYYPGDGLDRTIYLFILFSHMILAVVVLPLVLRSLYLAWRQRYDAHRKIARITYPIWMYVSVTGVIVYLMLYHLASALHGTA